MKNSFTQIYGCNMALSSLHRCNGSSFVGRRSDIWVTGCIYVESVAYVRECSSISLLGRWMILWQYCDNTTTKL